MKTLTIFSTVALSMFAACSNPSAPEQNAKETTGVDSSFYSADRPYSKPVLIDSANKMIQSYLASIHPDVNTDEIRSLIFDANLLRVYLNDSSQGKIENLKMMLAHKLSYINTGHFGQRPDSNSDALTLVLVGYGANGNYIYYDGNHALNICQPCPRECPESGTAASDVLVQ